MTIDSISLLNSILCDLCSFEASKPCWVSSASLLFHCTTSIPITLIGLNQCTTSIQINFIGLTKNILRIYVNARKWFKLSPPRFLNWFSIYYIHHNVFIPYLSIIVFVFQRSCVCSLLPPVQTNSVKNVQKLINVKRIWLILQTCLFHIIMYPEVFKCFWIYEMPKNVQNHPFFKEKNKR